MEWKLYFALSFAMFMEYAIWGAWMPVLAARLLGPLKMTGKQTGWIYATFPIACIFMPLVSGQLADKYVNTEIILAIAHLLGAACMYLAVRQTKFKNLLVVMFCYSLCYCATLPLVNSLMFHHLGKVYDSEEAVNAASANIFIWAPIGWALIAWSLTGWRWKFKTGEKGSDCLYLAAVLSLIMGIGCFFLPDTSPAGAGTAPIFEAMQMFKDTNFLVFIAVSMVFFGLMQFYFLGTAPFMQDRGIPAKNVPASMGIAQAVQAIATVTLMALLMDQIGTKWTLVVGAACWFVLYVAYVVQKPGWIIIACQPFHGLAYVLFVIVGQIFANTLASDEIRGSVQSLLFAATTGVGLFAGTQFAGVIMDKFRKDNKFQWRSIFTVPCAIALGGVLVFVFFLKG
ncbi:MAG: MFS transporter [Planctomycetes bacterium]|nr:MFS transporter [Planctomycetota bacterium]MBL7187122.1 MFS transporter [Phycisphaerae bacterium]